MHSQHIPCPDGAVLAGDLFVPSHSRGGVVIGSATGIKRQFYQPFAQFLADNGFSVLTFDYRGIGDSLSKSVSDCDATLIKWGEIDLTAALNHLKSRAPNRPLFLVGHSAGGQLAGLMRNAHDLCAMFNVGSSSGSLHNMRFSYQLKAHFFMNMFIPLSNLLFGHTKAQWVGIGEPLPPGVAKQWRRWCNGQGYVKTSFGKEITRHLYDELTLPAKWVVAEDDDIACEKNVREMMSVYSKAANTLEILQPSQWQLKRIGHMKFFSRQSAALWQLPIEFFQQCT
ncbi:alpha/beta hydrolase family protein [Alteromonas sp. ASW11-130]|uniref:alpha/beta hydrolase family protein n=1 Tax=Alteromonas sp. ASW11-130 TaxID=3015775 RepID=UPI00224275DB|nr:alpha/beta fold hydrolase [Alteromonas sp. ASW11-130]MCW8090921.1 alpha/beta fold hydrolase [Alteromonas sp. ASW11-130]